MTTWTRYAFERDPLTFAWYVPGSDAFFDFTAPAWNVSCAWLRNGTTLAVVGNDDLILGSADPNVVVPIPDSVLALPAPAVFSILLAAIDVSAPLIYPVVFSPHALPTFRLRPSPADLPPGFPIDES